MSDPLIKKVHLRNPVHLLAVGFGSGLMPVAPGTFGTVAAIPFYWYLSSVLSLSTLLLFVIVSAIVGCYLCGKTASDMGTHDHGSIVWDEFVGFWITMLLVPTTIYTIAVGFLLFRLLDILKPWPISYIDKKCKGGLGIMLDDLLAGLIAMVILYFLSPWL